MSANVIKFGGTSLCSAAAMINAANLVKSDGDISAVVVSAPGKRGDFDRKITDILYDICKNPDHGADIATIRERFEEIARGLGQKADVSDICEKILRAAKAGDVMLCASRGEYFSAKIFSALTGFCFVDAASAVKFDGRGALQKEQTYALIRRAVSERGRIVLPGFYGSDTSGRIITFERGGSDISGAVVAAALGADVYRNYTDVGGFMFADPKYGENVRVIRQMSYAQAHFLARHGSGVLCEGAIPYAADAGVTINVRNSFCPTDGGSVISDVPCADTVYGVAARKNADGVSEIAVGTAEYDDITRRAEKIIARCGGSVISTLREDGGIVLSALCDIDLSMREIIKELA